MTQIRNFLKRSSFLAGALVILAAWTTGDLVFLSQTASAAQLSSRKLTLSSSANGSTAIGVAGSGTNGSQAKHTVNFTMGSSGATISTIALIYCDNPLPQTACTSSTAATGSETALTSATVTGLTGTWSLDTTTNNPTVTNYGTCNGATTTRNNCVLLKATGATANAGTPAVTIAYGGTGGNYVANPTNNTTFYVRVIAFSDTGYATPVDNGSVASATAQQIAITAKVQETLNFSVGSAVTAPTAACTAFSDGGTLALGDVNGTLSFSTAYDAHSYFRVSTNANNGTVIYYSGDTLKSGANSISSIGLASGGTSSAVGSSQFGLAIDSSDTQTGSGYSFTNLAANNGANIGGHAYNYSLGNGTITNGGTAKFQFDTASVTTPDPIAIASGTITCDTGSVRYVGNVSTTTPPGIYTTKISYLAVPTY